MSKTIIEVTPVIETPVCIKNGNKQDCFNCEEKVKKQCVSPRKFCTTPYINNPTGCPKYNTRDSCPPNAPMFDEVFNMEMPFYAVLSVGSNNEIAKANLVQYVEEFKLDNPNYHACLSPEALGVDINKTLNLTLEWQTKSTTTRVALLGIVCNEKYLHILN